MKVVALVPIKLNNERLPNKNILKFSNGAPLISYILNTLSHISEIDETVVYCSDASIKEYLPPNVTYLKRNQDLDTSDTSMNTILRNFLKDVDADVYILTHATSPFVKTDSIRKGLSKVLKEGYDSAFAVESLQTFIWKDGEPFNYDLKNIPRTQDLDPLLAETSGFYIFKKHVFQDNQTRIGKTPYLVNVDKIEAIDIDEAIDFLIADAIESSILKGRKYV